MVESMSVTSEEILARAFELSQKMQVWRRTIHQFPELGFQEFQTASLVNSVLSELGIETRVGVAKTGVIGQISGSDGPLVALRADMDALPIQEVNGTDFDSTRPGIMHACGHDAHTAILLGAATILSEIAEQGRLPGSVRLVFQPSEEFQDAEGMSGGMRMVAEGVMDGIDAVFGLHVDPDNPVGVISTRAGAMLAAADTFKISIHGSGGHAARPHETVDTIALAGLLINTIHHLVSRRLDPLEAGVVTIGTIHGGSVDNVIPDMVTMTGTIRSFSDKSRQLLFDEIHRCCNIIGPLGGHVQVEIIQGYPPTYNHPLATERIVTAAQKILGEEHVFESPMYMGAEDFSFLLQKAPGCFISLGTHDPTWEESSQLHQPNLRISEQAFPFGAAILAYTAIEWMSKK